MQNDDITSIQSLGGKAVLKKYGNGHMKKLAEKRWSKVKRTKKVFN